MARMAASVSAYAVSRTRFAWGAIFSARARNSTPLMPGIRWSATSRATGSPRRTICSTMPSPASPESASRTRWRAP